MPVPERAALVGLVIGGMRRHEGQRSLAELGGLARAAGAEVVVEMLQERPKPDPATFIGGGKVDSLARLCDELGIDVVIVDNELTPGQLRQLEARVSCRVIDRTQLILDIFASRARTREGKWQVELAQLQYLLPRLVGQGAALSRLGGGIGTRGPGETKLESDRRRIRSRIQTIQRDIDQWRTRREQSRRRRTKQELPTVALVGYTNAGKTTLFNRLTRERAVASDALFVTLDPLVRQVRVPGGGEFLLTDTVGFIDRLPHALVAAFRATLEEVAAAALVLHVIDAADPERERSMAAVHRVLAEVGAEDVPRIDVFNKIDRLEAAERTQLGRVRPGAVLISAAEGTGIQDLLDAVSSRLGLGSERVTVTFDTARQSDRDAIAQVFRTSNVISQVVAGDRVVVEADIPKRLIRRLKARDGDTVCAP